MFLLSVHSKVQKEGRAVSSAYLDNHQWLVATLVAMVTFFPNRKFPMHASKQRSSFGNKKLLFLHAQIKRSHPSVINVFLTVEDSHGFLPVAAAAAAKQQLITNSRQPWHNIPLPFIS